MIPQYQNQNISKRSCKPKVVTPVSRTNTHAELVVVMEWGRIVDEVLLMRGLRFSCVEGGGRWGMYDTG